MTDTNGDDIQRREWEQKIYKECDEEDRRAMNGQMTDTQARMAKHLIVSVNDEGEHEIIFVTNNVYELMKRWSSFAGVGAIYKIGWK